MTSDLTNKKVITAALTGAIHTPSMSPYLPITPEQLIEEAVAAHAAGAAVVHLHVRNPENGMPNADQELFRQIAVVMLFCARQPAAGWENRLKNGSRWSPR